MIETTLTKMLGIQVCVRNHISNSVIIELKFGTNPDPWFREECNGTLTLAWTSSNTETYIQHLGLASQSS